tara:strand:- start:1514 stop:1732 length:219 start_codon:yes stop_codon:yes gene_type:complete
MKSIFEKQAQSNRRLLISALLAVVPPSVFALIVDLNNYAVSGYVTWPMLALWLYFILNYVLPWDNGTKAREE